MAQSTSQVRVAFRESTPDEIRLRIDETRAEMGETIDAIHARLSPSGLMHTATEKISDATVGRVVRLANKPWVRNNPVLVGFVGVAATGLIVQLLRRARGRR